MKQPIVQHIMSDNVVTLHENEDLELAGTLMQLARIRHLPVVDDVEKLVGIITHRDLLRAQGSALAESLANDRPAATIKAKELMSHVVKSVSPDTPVLAAAQIIHGDKLGCLPVVEDDRLVGIITEADFVRLVIEGLQGEEASN